MTTKLTKMPVPTVGPRPEGNPDAMRRLAKRCLAHGESLLDGARGAKDSVDPTHMNFNGLAAVNIRASVGRNSHHARGVAFDLEHFANTLLGAAFDLDTALSQYNARVQAAQDAKDHNAAVDRQNKGQSSASNSADAEFGPG